MRQTNLDQPEIIPPPIDNQAPPSPPPISSPSLIAKPKPRFALLFLIAFLFVGGSALAFYAGTYYQNNRYIPGKQYPSPTSRYLSPTPTLTPTPTQTALSDKINWLAKPQKIKSLGIFISPVKGNQDLEMYHLGEEQYYLTATLPDKSELINVFLPVDGMGVYNELYRFIKSPDNKISFIDLNNQWENAKKIFTADIALSSFNIRELDPPESINFDNNFFKKGYLKEGTFDQVDNPKLVKETEYGNLYVVYTPDKTDPDLRGRDFLLKLKDWTYYSYNKVIPFMSDDMTAYIQYLDGTTSKSQYLNKIKSGCGTGYFGPDTIKDGSSLLVSKEIVATYNQQNIYQIKDVSNPILKTIYESYKTGREYPSAPPVVSLEAFVQAKNHFIYQDFLGDWLLFVSQDYAPMAECGKPVIYLYPSKDTQVTVKVAAKITKSEPTYPQTGWTVLAHPNGQLEYQGQSYPNLFWEGTGNGQYPDISNRGFVVTQKDLIPTIKKHLSLQGLNAQEISDFLDFWTDKLPATPYIRLTWLTTTEMNRLAPLEISPLPETSIRVFLDFQGLSKPISLIPQKLISVPRKGFTLIEWGGLLIK